VRNKVLLTKISLDMKTQKLTLTVFGLIALFLFNTCAVNPVTGKKQFMMMSESQEVAMGAEYEPQVLATFGVYEDAELQNFLQTKVNEMGLQSHRPNLQYHIKVLDSPVVNAFAVPGGYIYLTRGILTHFNNEAELIGVIGHEMGHITARHSVVNQSQQTLAQLLLIGGMIASEKFRQYGEYAMQGMQLLFLSFSRAHEREADRLGVEYASRIGYDGSKFADFYKLLIRMSPPPEQGGVPTFMSTHPDPGDRYNAVNQDAVVWKDSLDFNTWKVNENSYLQMIDGMVYGEDPRQGYTDGNVFYHPELKFQFTYPAGWQFENSPMQVRMAPQDGNALIIFALTQGSNLQAAAQNDLRQLEVNVLESQNITVHGLPAIAVVSEQSSQDQNTGQVQNLRIRSQYINDNGTFYVFHGVTLMETFDGVLPRFNSTMASFAKLTDPARINVKPNLIHVKRVQNTGTLADALRYHGVTTQKLEEHSFLNNMELTERVQAGKMIKVIGQ
jgi:predicted Zn-dependent protease